MSLRLRTAGIVAAALTLAFTATPSASAAPALRTTLEVADSWTNLTEDVNVRFTLSNSGDQSAWVLKWQTPFAGVESNLFDVQRDGEPVTYLGRMYKLPAPTKADFLEIKPGQTLSTVVELTALYDMSLPGEYGIRFRINLTEGLGRIATRGLDFAEELTSAPVFVFREGEVEERALLQDERAADDDLGVALGLRYLTPTYVSCSSSRKSAIVSALSSAQSYASNASSYMNSGATGARYTTWFGSYNSSRYSTVRTHYSSILSTIQTKQIKFNCGCTSSAYAYVYPGSPYQIYLCNAFWAAPTTGTDSKAGTIIHELSHFYVVASTDDWAYGQSACKSLATSNPSRAIDNADSHEYFAENTPFQN